MAAVLPPSTPSQSTSASASVMSVDISAPSPATLRRNEHLAVMITRELWKPDSEAKRCDTFNCPRRFSLFERRHHCRRCGGVFCQPCSSRETALLDVSKLDFHLPPRGVPIAAFDSPASPVLTLRVCDGCYDAVHGQPPKILPPAAASAASLGFPSTSSPRAIKPPSPSSSICTATSSAPLSTPPDGHPLPSRRGSSTSIAGSLPPHLRTRSPRHSLLPAQGPLTIEQVAPELAKISCGELDAYPLRFSSAICKATGGGLWAPKAVAEPLYPPGKPGTDGFLVGRPGSEELAERRRRMNPIIKHGAFQYRFSPQAGSPPPPRYPVSTF